MGSLVVPSRGGYPCGRRPITICRPSVENIESKQLPSGSAASAASVLARSNAVQASAQGDAQTIPAAGLTLFRITTPQFPDTVQLHGPFQQVRVQSTVPKPGGVYNILSVTVKNGTGQTYDASSGFQVKLSGQSKPVAVLTGNEQWKPGQYIVFYALSKKYYPIRPVVSAGFQFNFAGKQAVAIPGPSGIYLRATYAPATFPRLLDWIVVYGPGAKGHALGLPDTAIWELTSTLTNVEPL